eukprot:scaffold54130_cov37-Prasinocladus_malaysianus.AAC.2
MLPGPSFAPGKSASYVLEYEHRPWERTPRGSKRVESIVSTQHSKGCHAGPKYASFCSVVRRPPD